MFQNLIQSILIQHIETPYTNFFPFFVFCIYYYYYYIMNVKLDYKYFIKIFILNLLKILLIEIYRSYFISYIKINMFYLS